MKFYWKCYNKAAEADRNKLEQDSVLPYLKFMILMMLVPQKFEHWNRSTIVIETLLQLTPLTMNRSAKAISIEEEQVTGSTIKELTIVKPSRNSSLICSLTNKAILFHRHRLCRLEYRYHSLSFSSSSSSSLTVPCTASFFSDWMVLWKARYVIAWSEQVRDDETNDTISIHLV